MPEDVFSALSSASDAAVVPLANREVRRTGR